MRHLLDTITDVTPDHAGSIVLSGSHGGLYPATLASRAGLRAVVFNDAGIGLEQAGIAGVRALAECGMAAASADCMSCEIGSADDMLSRGRLSHVNAVAEGLGLAVGMSAAEAAPLLDAAPEPTSQLAKSAETRREVVLPGAGTRVTLLDSAALVGAQDAGGVVVTGSHGGLVGGDPTRALKASLRVAVFNDAGGGRNGVGMARLPALERMGGAAVTVGHDSARIGDATSALETGVISAVNAPAAQLGARVGQPLADWLRDLPAMG